MTENSSTSLWKRVRHIIFIYYRATTHLYVLAVLIHIIIDLLFGERWTFIGFLNTFVHLIWLPAFVLLLLNIVMRQRDLSLIVLIPILAFLFTWGKMFLPNRGADVSQSDNSMRIMTYNLFGYNTEEENYIALIREADADIVALQEVSYINSPTIESQLKDSYPYMALHPTDNPTQGQGILSRYPIVDDTFWMYDFARHMLGHQRVEIQLDDDQSIIIYNVHPSHPGMQGSAFDPRYRSMEIDAILQETADETQTHLIMGDFNMPEMSDDYAKIRMSYRDAFRDVGYGMGWTFPDTATLPPILRLDYLFYKDGVTIQNAQVGLSSAGSDHRPLIVDLLILNQ